VNRTDVLERLEPIMHTQVRPVEHNPRTRVVVTPDMVTFRPGGGARTLEMTEGGVKSMVHFCGLPEPVAKHLRPETFGLVSTELLASKHRYSLVVKDSAVTHIARSSEYHSVNPERALRAVERAIPGIDFHRVLILDNLVASLEVVGDRRQPVKRGDLIQAGANISFSPLGTVDPVVRSYVLRLACTNGQTSNTVLREFHYGGGGDGGGEGDDIWQWFRRSTREAYGALDRIVARYRQLITDRIPADQRAMLLERMLREAKISGRDAEAVRALALERPPQNSYDMMNLITYATSHIIERPNVVRRAQVTVANYTHEETHALLCPVCHTRRN